MASALPDENSLNDEGHLSLSRDGGDLVKDRRGDRSCSRWGQETLGVSSLCQEETGMSIRGLKRMGGLGEGEPRMRGRDVELGI